MLEIKIEKREREQKYNQIEWEKSWIQTMDGINGFKQWMASKQIVLLELYKTTNVEEKSNSSRSVWVWSGLVRARLFLKKTKLTFLGSLQYLTQTHKHINRERFVSLMLLITKQNN